MMYANKYALRALFNVYAYTVVLMRLHLSKRNNPLLKYLNKTRKSYIIICCSLNFLHIEIINNDSFTIFFFSDLLRI